jgi:hypothetical protein
MTFLVARAFNSSEKDLTSSHHIFSIVASKNSVKHVYPNKKDEAKWDKRVERLVKDLKIDRPNNSETWLDLATRNMSTTEFVLLETEDSISSLSEAVKNERKALEESKKGRDSKAPRYDKADEMAMRELSKLEDLMADDPELEAFLNGEDVKEIPQGYKEFIKFLVQQAGTEDLNPWLEPWLAGETENLNFNNGLVLDRNMVLEPTTDEEKTNG